MAKPIKETPVLTGRDAIRLAERIDKPKAVTQKEVENARIAYQTVMSIAKFKF